MDLEPGDRVVTRGETVPPALCAQVGTVRDVKEWEDRPVLVELDNKVDPGKINNSIRIYSFDRGELTKINQ